MKYYEGYPVIKEIKEFQNLEEEFTQEQALKVKNGLGLAYYQSKGNE